MFETIVGHQQNKAFLQRFLNREERPHALLFYGPEGIGKCLLAKEFARAFLCQGPDRATAPCNHCESCRLLNFETGNFAHPDYLYFDPMTDEEQEKKKLKIISVNQVRNLIKQAAFGPTLSEHKVCIINEADTMNTEAANSLLKLLEEPPDKWLFILIATSVNRLLPTILSRVIQVRFTPLTLAETKKVLLQKEIPEAEADLLAHLSDGSLGQALRFREERIMDFRDAALKYVAEFPRRLFFRCNSFRRRQRTAAAVPRHDGFPAAGPAVCEKRITGSGFQYRCPAPIAADCGKVGGRAAPPGSRCGPGIGSGCHTAGQYQKRAG